MISCPKKELLFVIAITAAIMFFNLGGIPLLDPDEPVYAETPLEMIAFHDFLSPRIYGEYWYDKPPLYYWLVAGAFKLFGVSEFAARFPSALLAVCGVAFVYHSGSQLFSRGAGMAGALVLATSIEYFYLGKAAVTDITLTFCLTAALLSFLRKKYYLFYAFAGLAVLAKGPVGLLFPGAILFLYMVVTRQFSLLGRIKLPGGIVIFSLLALPWYVMMYQVHGNVFLDTFIGFHNVTRFTSPEHPENVLWYYFLPVLLLGFFPWTAVLFQSIWKSLTVTRSDEFNTMVFLNIWAIFIFLFFSISQTKLVSYILPMYPPLAMIAGWYINRLIEMNKSVRPLSWPVLLTVFTVLWSVGLLFGLKNMPELAMGVWAETAVLAVMTAMVWHYYRSKSFARAFWIQIAGMTIFVVLLVGMLFPAVAPRFASTETAQDFIQFYDRQSPIYVFKFLRPGFAFYSGYYGNVVFTEAELNDRIDNAGKAYFVIRRIEYDYLSEHRRASLSILSERAGGMLLIKQ